MRRGNVRRERHGNAYVPAWFQASLDPSRDYVAFRDDIEGPFTQINVGQECPELRRREYPTHMLMLHPYEIRGRGQERLVDSLA